VTILQRLVSIYSGRGAAAHFGEAVTTIEHSLQAAHCAQASNASEARLHVPAKRYLCATDPSFIGRLSSASIQTLKLQGGPMSGAEIIAFEAEPFRQDALQLRRRDDQGKIAGLRTPGFLHFRGLIERLSAR
jgi:predicted HD phosphohydrolase